MLRTVSLQALVSGCVAIIAWAVAGFHAGCSALLGGLACVIPNAVFALRLSLAARRPGGAQVSAFFVGEFVKLALTVLLLFAVASQYRELNWLALIVGFIAALKGYLVLFFLDRHK